MIEFFLWVSTLGQMSFFVKSRNPRRRVTVRSTDWRKTPEPPLLLTSIHSRSLGFSNRPAFHARAVRRRSRAASRWRTRNPPAGRTSPRTRRWCVSRTPLRFLPRSPSSTLRRASPETPDPRRAEHLRPRRDADRRPRPARVSRPSLRARTPPRPTDALSLFLRASLRSSELRTRPPRRPARATPRPTPRVADEMP
jgi:hypothetical protein